MVGVDLERRVPRVRRLVTLEDRSVRSQKKRFTKESFVSRRCTVSKLVFLLVSVELGYKGF